MTSHAAHAAHVCPSWVQAYRCFRTEMRNSCTSSLIKYHTPALRVCRNADIAVLMAYMMDTCQGFAAPSPRMNKQNRASIHHTHRNILFRMVGFGMQWYRAATCRPRFQACCRCLCHHCRYLTHRPFQSTHFFRYCNSYIWYCKL